MLKSSYNLKSLSLFIPLLWLSITPTLRALDLPPHLSNQIIIKHKAGVNKSYLAGINKYLGAKTKKYFDNAKISVIKLDDNHSLDEALFLYQIDPSIDFAEPDYLLFTTDTLVNDNDFIRQWGLDNNDSHHGVADIDINAPVLWDQSIGNQSQIIVVNDSGVDYHHPDLMANLWTNPGEIANNNIDDDSNGYIDDIYGINAIDHSGNPIDDNGHGTHVAGILGGVANNHVGISGIMQEAKIIACKFIQANGTGASSDAITCLDYALNLKTRSSSPQNIVVTNNSWAANIYSQALYDAIKAHDDANIMFVTAADNYGLNNDLFPTYPSNYHLANIISVAAIDRNGLLASFSNYGSHSVHVAAPGTEILSSYPNNSYQILDGTSMATPFVSGLFAILSGFYPNNSIYQNKNLILASGKELASLSHKIISESLIRGSDIDGVGALSCQNQKLFKSTWPRQNIISIPVNTSLDLEVINIICSEPAGDFNANINPNNLVLPFKDDGNETDLKANDGLYAASFRPEEIASYDISLAGLESIQVESFDSLNWRNYNLSLDSNFTYRVINGTRLDLGDDDLSAIISPFALKFGHDNSALTHVYIGSNGTISLSDHQILDWENSSLPKEGFSSIIAPLWLDLDPSQATEDEGVFYAVSGSAPERELIIEWRQVKPYLAKGKVSFQVVFKEASSDIGFAYLDLDSNSPNYNGGRQASIGLQVRDLAVDLARDFVPLADHTSFTFKLLPLASTTRAASSNSKGGSGNTQLKPSYKISSPPPPGAPSKPSNLDQAPIDPVLDPPEPRPTPQLSINPKALSCSSTNANMLWPSLALIYLWLWRRLPTLKYRKK